MGPRSPIRWRIWGERWVGGWAVLLFLGGILDGWVGGWVGYLGGKIREFAVLYELAQVEEGGVLGLGDGIHQRDDGFGDAFLVFEAACCFFLGGGGGVRR